MELTADRLGELNHAHQRSTGQHGHCNCGRLWPCAIAELLSHVEAQQQELKAIHDARERIHAGFRAFGPSGKCECVYCRGDADGLAELAAEYELDLNFTKGKLAKVKDALRDMTEERDSANALQATLMLLGPNDLRASFRPSDSTIHIGEYSIGTEHARRIASDILGLIPADAPTALAADPGQGEPPQLSKDEQILLDEYRQNKCGDHRCESLRQTAARIVLRGTDTHAWAAQLVHDAVKAECDRGIQSLAADVAAPARTVQAELPKSCEECQHVFSAADLAAEDRDAWGHPCFGTRFRRANCESHRGTVQAEPAQSEVDHGVGTQSEARADSEVSRVHSWSQDADRGRGPGLHRDAVRDLQTRHVGTRQDASDDSTREVAVQAEPAPQATERGFGSFHIDPRCLCERNSTNDPRCPIHGERVPVVSASEQSSDGSAQSPDLSGSVVDRAADAGVANNSASGRETRVPHPPEPACTNCGELAKPSHYVDFVGPFCEGCWTHLKEYFAEARQETPAVPPAWQPSGKDYIARASLLSACSWKCYRKYAEVGYSACCSSCQRIADAIAAAVVEALITARIPPSSVSAPSVKEGE